MNNNDVSVLSSPIDILKYYRDKHDEKYVFGERFPGDGTEGKFEQVILSHVFNSYLQKHKTVFDEAIDVLEKHFAKQSST